MLVLGLAVAAFLLTVASCRRDPSDVVREYLESEADLLVALNEDGSSTSTMPHADGVGTLRIVVTADTPDDYFVGILVVSVQPDGRMWRTPIKLTDLK